VLPLEPDDIGSDSPLSLKTSQPPYATTAARTTPTYAGHAE